MKIRTFLIFSLLFLCISACHQKPSPVEITRQEIDPVIDKWLELWATYELDMLDEIFAQSDDLTYFSSEREGLITGYDELIPHHQGFGFVSGGKKPEKSLWLEEISFRSYGETAMVGAVWYFGDKEAPKESVQKGPVTFLFVKNNSGEPRIMHTHFANY